MNTHVFFCPIYVIQSFRCIVVVFAKFCPLLIVLSTLFFCILFYTSYAFLHFFYTFLHFSDTFFALFLHHPLSHLFHTSPALICAHLTPCSMGLFNQRYLKYFILISFLFFLQYYFYIFSCKIYLTPFFTFLMFFSGRYILRELYVIIGQTCSTRTCVLA